MAFSHRRVGRRHAGHLEQGRTVTLRADYIMELRSRVKIPVTELSESTLRACTITNATTKAASAIERGDALQPISYPGVGQN